MAKRFEGSIPERFHLCGSIGGNAVQQLCAEAIRGNLQVEEETDARGRVIAFDVVMPGGERVRVVPTGTAPGGAEAPVLVTTKAGFPSDERGWDFATSRGARWLSPLPQAPEVMDAAGANRRRDLVLQSWRNQFFFREEEILEDGTVSPGLRGPQIGALHAVLAHWKVSEATATVVMPTGTGKTETMLALLVARRIPRLLVVVPSDALRVQIGRKFLTLGWLKTFGVVGQAASLPVVGTLTRMPQSREDADRILMQCNVLVTTMAIANSMSLRDDTLAQWASHVFIDEAHHVAAQTWDAFKERMAAAHILQFTATPFRQDGKPVGGKIIFNYPLRRAQSEGYFRAVSFRSVMEFDPRRADAAICEAAIAALNRDMAAGHDHLVMARAASIPRAERLHAIYQQMAPEHRPILVHSRQGAGARQTGLAALHTRASRIVVCVDMLGEGFDLPALKIAALHDMHKSLAITLQFTGRFTRSANGIGEATIIANIADANVEQKLQALYAEDSDWNELLRKLSEGATQREVRRSDFIDGFREANPAISLQNIFPKMSAVVFKTECADWQPEAILRKFPAERLYAGPYINRQARTLIVVARDFLPVPWGDIRDLKETFWHLYLLHWDRESGLLFINSSDNSSVHEDLATVVAGDSARLIRGEPIFRAMHGLNRFVIMSLGLRHLLSRNIQFSMHNGADVAQALAMAMRENKAKSNLFGKGFEHGEPITFGCSQKGRVWSHRVAYDLSEWVEWCHGIGAKLNDETISTVDVFRNVVIPIEVEGRPETVAIAVEWHPDLLARPQERVLIQMRQQEASLYDVELAITSHEPAGSLRFSVVADDIGAVSEYEVRIADRRATFVSVSGPEASISVGRGVSRPLAEWFAENPPTFYFADGAMMVGNELYPLPETHQRVPFPRERILEWDWQGTDIRMESQREERRPGSIQRKVVLNLLAEPAATRFDVVFDDDGSGEIADVVALRVTGNMLLVRLYHCKYSSDDAAGARVKDLYEVCGQAQRSVSWKGMVWKMLDRMRRREVERNQRGGTRFDQGELADLHGIARQLNVLSVSLEVYAVQPGVSKRDVSRSQLELLGVTENYLRETYDVPFWLIANH
ncbi:DEAD/DEAH box helicase family protein [Azoarcus sp. DN11]|uniref:DEAD/DEAH box helicase n=1 Tax=Azoarcus sp. DN11 TaxID=356837 RepID=UPI0013E35C9E|nr:DEAD/DEAH box helicase family protein [Azoarcus sp. DN11]